MDEVEEIRNRLDIVDVIGSYVPLKQAGRNFKGLSPFQQEKTPSFMVSPEKNIWHDFSSGQGGDIFTFVMKMEGVEFREALEILARRAGVELKHRSRVDKNKASSKSKIYELTEKASIFYQNNLAKNKKALEYLTQKRHLSKTTINNFHLGYASDRWEELSDYLLELGYSVALCKSAGLVGQKTGRTNAYDLFRGRIIFPIFDTQGRVIGFSARILDEKGKVDAPKYINTPETQIYHKSYVIYGLPQAKESIRKSDEVIIVEGNMDVISLHQLGQQNVVAVGGTALTVEQLKILSGLTKNIKLCLDNDEAGQKATLRAIELAGGLDISLSIILLKGAKDPDELIKKDKKAWSNAVKNAVYGIDYVFEQSIKKTDLSIGYGKRQAARLIMPYITYLADEIEKDHYIKKLAQILGVEEVSIRQKIIKTKGSNLIKEAQPDDQMNKKIIHKKLTKIENLELSMLELFLPFSFTREALSEVTIKDISPRFEPYFTQLSSHPDANLDKISKNLRQLGNSAKIIALRGEQQYLSFNKNDLRLEAYTQVHRWQREIREVNKRQLTRLIAKAEAVGDAVSAEKYLSNYQSLLSEES